MYLERQVLCECLRYFKEILWLLNLVLKDKGTDHEIKWSILKRAKPYSGKPSRCNLCLAEKLCILTADKSVLLNKRSELITKCRHENKFYAANQKPDRYDYPP